MTPLRQWIVGEDPKSNGRTQFQTHADEMTQIVSHPIDERWLALGCGHFFCGPSQPQADVPPPCDALTTADDVDDVVGSVKDITPRWETSRPSAIRLDAFNGCDSHFDAVRMRAADADQRYRLSSRGQFRQQNNANRTYHWHLLMNFNDAHQVCGSGTLSRTFSSSIFTA